MSATTLTISVSPHESSLRRGLSSTHVIGIVVSSMIGMGIFIRSASMMQEVGTAHLLMVAWVTAGLLSLAGALCYAELSTLMPRAGGEYVFLREAAGRTLAFLFGWMRFVVGAGMTAGVAVGVGTFLADASSLSASWWRVPLKAFTFTWQLDWGPRQIIALAAIGILAALNCRRVQASGTTQAIFAGFKVAVVLVLIVSAVLAAYGRGRPATVAPTADGSYGGFALAMLAALNAYNGWVSVTMLGGEVSNFRRSYARDIVVGTLIVIALYVLVNIGYVALLSPAEIASSNSAAHPDAPSVGANVARIVFGPSAATAMSVAFAVSGLGALHCHMLAFPRIFYAMAQDGMFFRAFARTDSRTSVPRTAIVSYAAWAALLALVGGFDRLTNMATFAFYLFYCCNVIALMVLRRRSADAERPFVVPAYPWIPLAFLVASLSMLGALIIRGAPEIIWALGLLALGLPACLLFQRIYGPTAAVPPETPV